MQLLETFMPFNVKQNKIKSEKKKKEMLMYTKEEFEEHSTFLHELLDSTSYLYFTGNIKLPVCLLRKYFLNFILSKLCLNS